MGGRKDAADKGVPVEEAKLCLACKQKEGDTDKDCCAGGVTPTVIITNF